MEWHLSGSEAVNPHPEIPPMTRIGLFVVVPGVCYNMKKVIIYSGD